MQTHLCELASSDKKLKLEEDLYIKFNNIYPNKLQLKKENEDSYKASFLDLSIEIHNRKLTTNLFVNRDAFPFYINSMPYLDSNMPSKTFYDSIGLKFYKLPGLQQIRLICWYMLIFCWYEGIWNIWVNEIYCFISQLKKKLWKTLKVFYKFEYIVQICNCMYFLWVCLCIYVYFMSVIYVFMSTCRSAFLVKTDFNTSFAN